MKLKCVIVDDEPLASEGLSKYIEIIDYLELVAIAENPMELDIILEKEAIDLILLDVQMPFMTGIEFLKIKTNLPMVIITTAFPNYALEGFQFDVVDYLLKPITFHRFFKATNKAKELFLLKNQKYTNSISEPESIFIKCQSNYEKIIIDDILFIQALQNYVAIHTEKSKYMSLMTLKSVEEYLDSQKFIRIHKSYLVAISKIERVENTDVVIQNHSLPYSRNLREKVIELVVKKNFLK